MTSDPTALDAGMFRDLFDAAPDGMIVVDGNGVILLTNAQATQLFGYAPDELAGQPIEILVPDDKRGGHVHMRDAFLREPTPRPMGSGLMLHGRHKSGALLPVEIMLSPLVSDGRRLTCAAVRDVSERQRAAELERRHAAIVDSSADGIIGISLDATVTSWNRGAAAIFGYAAAEMLGRPLAALVPDERSGEAKQNLARVVSGERVLHHETERRRQDGELIDVSVTMSPVHDAMGRIVGASKIVRDITERKRAEADVRHANELLRSAVESFHGAFAVFGADDRLVLCNSACRATFGRALEGALIGRRYEEIARANVSAGLLRAEASGVDVLTRWLDYHQRPEGSLELRTADGHQLRLVDRRTASGGTVSTAVDITVDIAREEELRAARAVAENASNAKSEFLASMSHELRTPLNAVLGFTQLLQRDKKNPLTDKQLERLGHVMRGGEHLLRLIDDVLDLARIEAGRVTISVEPVSVADVLASVETTLGPIAERASIALAFPADASVDVLADRTRLIQILLNYGSNAIKYGRAGGHVNVAVEAIDEAVRVAVADDGIGIPVEHQAHVFEPFRRAGQETGPIEGTGIGLAISERLATLMGGRVGFDSEVGRGTTFWVELPRPVQTATADTVSLLADAAGSLEAVGTDGRVIVYVEDNPSNIAFMEAFLSDYEHIQLITAPTAEIGIDVITTHKPHVVLMDINLPGMSGFDATSRLRESPDTAHIPIVAISAAAMPRDRERATTAGFAAYLTKPVQVDELTATLEGLLALPRPV